MPQKRDLISSCDGSYAGVFYACALPFYVFFFSFRLAFSCDLNCFLICFLIAVYTCLLPVLPLHQPFSWQILSAHLLSQPCSPVAHKHRQDADRPLCSRCL